MRNNVHRVQWDRLAPAVRAQIAQAMALAMRRQAGKIRLQRGVQNANGTGWGLAHIEARHGREIRSAGFESVAAFVADAVRHVD
ncbi:MAG: hypothetical protein RBT55_00605, partial [Rhodocyclaceae bacterium]|nr:hypothetical protein [Rhodocyclaceae bacterium]